MELQVERNDVIMKCTEPGFMFSHPPQPYIAAIIGDGKVTTKYSEMKGVYIEFETTAAKIECLKRRKETKRMEVLRQFRIVEYNDTIPTPFKSKLPKNCIYLAGSFLGPELEDCIFAGLNKFGYVKRMQVIGNIEGLCVTFGTREEAKMMCERFNTTRETTKKEVFKKIKFQERAGSKMVRFIVRDIRGLNLEVFTKIMTLIGVHKAPDPDMERQLDDFCFVTFEKTDSVTEGIHLLESESTFTVGRFSNDPTRRTIYVGRLPMGMRDDELRNYLETHIGNVHHLVRRTHIVALKVEIEDRRIRGKLADYFTALPTLYPAMKHSSKSIASTTGGSISSSSLCQKGQSYKDAIFSSSN
eukprot:TRINITY_DN53567_c0_g1_i1.p1 TRINITY_DN53567_c0_g1~~TRINITY_DN53567_c0_g1_i1.p1  ORF type:complete len:401 (+),score=67.83 TRINITY_DN53567_c0_g1_i1:134-1204(+)